MSDFRLLAGRVSLAGQDLQATAAEAFRLAFGQEAAEVQHRPLSPQLARGGQGGLALACAAQAGRIDFDIAAAGAAPGAPPAFIADRAGYAARLGAVFAAVRSPGFTQAAARVALRTQMAQVCADVAAANRAIMPVIRESYRPTLNQEQDFLLQLTNQFPSGRVRGLPLNLKVRWSVEADAAGAATAAVTFDTDTGAGDRAFTAEEQFLLLDELRQLTARANASLGLNVAGL
jgi:hypothetical protein